ncbi:unnamed protein product, partial [marine sediment metagenome]
LIFVPALVLCGPAFIIGIFSPNLMAGLIIVTAILSVLIGAYFLVLFQIAFLTAVVNRDIGVIESFRRAKTKVTSFLWIGILMPAIIIGGFLLLVVPGIILVVLLFFSTFILVAENVRGMNAILKSKHYVKGQFFGVLLRLFIIWLISMIVNVIPIVGQLLSILLIPFSMIYYFLIYENLKVIKSGEVFSPTGKTGIVIIAILGFLWIPVSIFLIIKSGVIKPSTVLTFKKTET